MTETPAKTFLIIFGNLLILAIGGGVFGVFYFIGVSIVLSLKSLDQRRCTHE